MKTITIALTSLICMCVNASEVHKQDTTTQNNAGQGVIHGSGIVNKSFVPPVLGKYAKTHNTKDLLKAANDESSIFNVIYQNEVSEEVKRCLNYATAIWETHITSSVPINVTVIWKEKTSETGSALASAGPNDYVLVPAINHLPANYAPIAIANRIYGSDLSQDAEIRVNIIENDYYYGIDGNCPEDKYDLVTILLHELCHGLGFLSSADRVKGEGEISLGNTNYNGSIEISNGVGVPFDYYMIDHLGKKLMDTENYENPSKQLYTALTNNNLFFDAPLTTMANGGAPVKLYAPGLWDNGSSVSHVNEGTYQSDNSLMSPQADLGEAIHNPGTLALAMLGDIGWDYVWLNIADVKDRIDATAPLRITASVRSDSPLSGNPVLSYRFPKQATEGTVQAYTSVPMLFDAASEKYYYDLQLNGTAQDIEYFVQANASAGRIFRAPNKPEINPAVVTVGPDMKAPTISHELDTDFIFSNRPSLTLFYNSTDNIALSSIVTEVIIDNSSIDPLVYYPQPGESEFFTELQFNDLSAFQTLNYRFTATDASVNQNQAKLPADGFFSLNIENIYASQTSYNTNFEDGKNDFILKGFDITTPAGFQNGTLGSEHSYQNAGGSNTLNFYAYLRQQILIQAGTTISFDEIVLVEPGEDGVSFGSSGFYDYVVVEGSKDGGTTWAPITAGYDSKSDSSWLDSYNSSKDEGGNSATQGTPAMFKNRRISFDQSTEFNAGDNVVIRFRLYSDPLTVGWGWAIDNLRIGVQ